LAGQGREELVTVQIRPELAALGGADARPAPPQPPPVAEVIVGLIKKHYGPQADARLAASCLPG
jgi:hypothetical protein